MELLYIDRIPAVERQQFVSQLITVANYLGISNPNWLMQVFYAESKVNPQAVNKTGGATGLIQFMPATARALGTTTAALQKMTATQQLPWVQKYFAPYRNRLNSYFDVYLVVFFPAAIGKGDSWVIQSKNLSPEIIAKQNPAINIIKDKQITVAEFKQYLVNTVPKAFRDFVFSKPLATAGVLLLFTALFF